MSELIYSAIAVDNQELISRINIFDIQMNNENSPKGKQVFDFFLSTIGECSF
ncbi:hypothetical protein [Radiobacillus sp. PE A8.2]|uniref:hypothetical protein n=1 Tax=Radiobacillus sp. PE A8.2 TaxID=3380349 RepID=UPI00388F6E37